MPDEYKQTATDPKTGKKVGWDGKAWVPIAEPSGFDKFSMDVTRGMGLDPEKIRAAYHGGGGVTGQLKEIGSEVGGGLKSWIGSVAKDPAHIADPLHGMASPITHGAGLPDKPGESFHAPVPGELVGGMAMVAGGAEGAEKARAVSGKAAIRDVMGVGKRDVELYQKKTGIKEAAVQDAATKKLETARAKYADAVQEAIKKRAEASAKETAAKTKQEALVSKHGPVYKRMNEMADTAREHVSQIEQKVNAVESGKWSKFSKEMGNAPVNSESTVKAITDAQEKILSGESLPIFKQILAELPGTDPDVEAMLAHATPSMRERLLASGIKESPEVGLDTARKLYTKIGRKLGGSELPRDVARALSSVQDALDDSIAKSVTKKGGADALRQYRKLQADWKQYRQTFSDRDSPLRKIMEAKDPSTKLGPITGETGARAVEYLGRYRNLGAQPEQLGKIRAVNKALKELPGGGGKAPEMPERPQLPEKPSESKSIGQEQARREMLEKKETFFSRPPSRWEIMFPPLMMYKMALKHAMQNPKFVEWLSKEGGGTSPVP